MLLKANKPDKFADRSKTELSNPDGTFKPENETAAAARIDIIHDMRIAVGGARRCRIQRIHAQRITRIVIGREIGHRNVSCVV